MFKKLESGEPSLLVSLCEQEIFYDDLQGALSLPCSTEEELKVKHQEVGKFWLMVWHATWLDSLEHRKYSSEFVNWFRTWDHILKAAVERLEASVGSLR